MNRGSSSIERLHVLASTDQRRQVLCRINNDHLCEILLFLRLLIKLFGCEKIMSVSSMEKFERVNL